MLLEREHELGLLAGLQAGVGSSGGTVVLLRGEAGIGKSALVEEFIESVASQWHVLLGVCDDLGTPQTFGPIWDFAREEPALKEHLESGDRRAVMGTLLDLLSRNLRPTVLVIEDTHWADEGTLDVVKFLGRRIARTNALIILTYRDSEVDYEHPLRRVIGELAPKDLTRIGLSGLSAAAVSALLEDSDIDADHVLELTDGNPLFVTEVLDAGVEGVPSSVQDSVLARATRLSADARQTLELVSVIPGEVDRELLERILGSVQEELLQCVRLGLLRVHSESVSFRHEMTRRAVESALTLEERRRLNTAVLSAYGDSINPSRLVHHAKEASDVEAIITFAPAAARQAMAAQGYREASAHFRTVEPHLDQMDVAEQASILDEWIRSEFHLHQRDVLELVERADALHRLSGNELALARSLAMAVRPYEYMSRSGEADASAAEAIAILEGYPSNGDLAFATAQLAWLSGVRSQWPACIRDSDRAISLAQSSGNDLALIHALNTKGFATYTTGDPAGLDLLEEARGLAEKGGYAYEECRALLNMTLCVAGSYEIERSVDLSLRALETAVRHELGGSEVHALAHYAQALKLRGEWARAEDAASEAVLATYDNTATYARMVLGSLLTRQGRPDALQVLEQNLIGAEALKQMQVLLPAASARSEFMWLNDESDPEKVKRFRAILDRGTIMGEATQWWNGTLALWLWLLDELTEIPARIAEPFRHLMEGNPMEAAAAFRKKGMPYEQALALMHGPSPARLQALEIFESLGAVPAAAKLRGSLREDGIAVPRGKGKATRAHVSGLTERQAEVLRLLGDNLTNAEIADRLFISPRTVENHVSALLSKLGASTRDEAVTLARTEGLLA